MSESAVGQAASPACIRGRTAAEHHWRFQLAAFGTSALMVAAALAVGLALQEFLQVSNIALVLLTAVLMSAIAYGLWPALAASVLSAFAYNFFFLPPVHTLNVSNPENIVTLSVFTLAAVVVSNLTARLRAQAILARNRARTMQQLYEFSRKLAGVVDLEDLLWATAYQFASMLNVRVVLLLPDQHALQIRAGYPPDDQLDLTDFAAASHVWRHGVACGRGAGSVPAAQHLFLPMRTSRGVVAVAGFERDGPERLLTPDQEHLFEALAGQAALAIERITLAQDVQRARVAAETERLRSALLTSISHDFRTPLASILGSASSLKSFGSALDDAARGELLDTISDEAERLNRFVTDLLDMTRLEAGGIHPRREAVDLADIVGSASRRAKPLLGGHTLTIDIEPDLPLLDVDPVLLEQVIFNLLDNAAKYTAGNAPIEIGGHRTGDAAVVTVGDHGSGIPNADLECIFDKFYRVRTADRQRAGSGLGLAICRGFVEAMRGTIAAANRTDGQGAIFTVTLPVVQRHDLVVDDIR